MDHAPSSSSLKPHTASSFISPILPKIVPWTGLDEWRFVKDALFSVPVNTEDLCFALELGEVWRLRGKLPVAVDATLSLKRIQLALLTQGGIYDPVILQLALSAALLRMVNELTDPGQRGQYAMPINRLAENIGLPRILVDIRHEATHDTLPSLPTLELGLEIALEWLYANYWEPFSQSTLASSLRDRVEGALNQIASLSSSDIETSIKTAQKILTSEIEHLVTSREKQAMLASVLMTSKWINSPIFKLIEACLIRLDCFTSFTMEFLLSSLTNDSVITPILLERVRGLVGHASFIPERGAIARVLHTLMLHISKSVLSMTNILFESPEVMRHCPEQTLLYQQVVSSFSGSEVVPSVSSSQLEQVLNRMESDQKIYSAAKPGYFNGWKPIAFGCCPDYDPIRDGFYKQCYPSLLNNNK